MLNTSIVPKQQVKTHWVPNMRQHYEDLGYEFTKQGDVFWVDVGDLKKSSHLKVNVQCPHCLEVRSKVYKDIFRDGHTYCHKCVSLSKRDNLVGRKFGRLTVIEFSHNAHGHRYWKSICDCGDGHVGTANALKSGHIQSCGCLRADRVREAISGNKHPRWNSRLTDADREGRRITEDYRIWRTSVYERDKYKCNVCKQVGGKLNAHHLYSYANYPDLRFDLDNGITLCVICHKAFHDIYGKGNNTKSQYIEFTQEQEHGR